MQSNPKTGQNVFQIVKREGETQREEATGSEICWQKTFFSLVVRRIKFWFFLGKKIIFNRIKMFGTIPFFMGQDQTGHFCPSRYLCHSFGADNTIHSDLFTCHSLYRSNYSHIKMSKRLFFPTFFSFLTRRNFNCIHIWTRNTTRLLTCLVFDIFKFRAMTEQKDASVYSYT